MAVSKERALEIMALIQMDPTKPYEEEAARLAPHMEGISLEELEFVLRVFAFGSKELQRELANKGKLFPSITDGLDPPN